MCVWVLCKHFCFREKDVNFCRVGMIGGLGTNPKTLRHDYESLVS